MSWDIDEASLNVLTFILANVREMDRKEILCQLDTDENMPVVVGGHIDAVPSPHKYVIRWKNWPVAAWGAMPTNSHVWQAWAFGTRRMVRAVPLITHHILGVIRPDLVARGAQRVEIRSLKGHAQVDRWLAGMGCVHECEVPCFGRNGETFNQWAWRRHDFDRNLRASRSV